MGFTEQYWSVFWWYFEKERPLRIEEFICLKPKIDLARFSHGELKEGWFGKRELLQKEIRKKCL